MVTFVLQYKYKAEVLFAAIVVRTVQAGRPLP